jgi:hypothetical protein
MKLIDIFSRGRVVPYGTKSVFICFLQSGSPDGADSDDYNSHSVSIVLYSDVLNS